MKPLTLLTLPLAASVASACVLAAPAAAAAPVDDRPEIVELRAAATRIDSYIDELRADIVVRTPAGAVDPDTGAGLTLAYDYYGQSSPTPTHRASFMASSSASGASAWARNTGDGYTIHEVVTSAGYDYLVISVQGDLNLPDRAPGTNTPGGSPDVINIYTTLASGERVAYPLDIRTYSSERAATTVSGPEIQIAYDNTWGLWSGGQAYWGASVGKLDPSGVLPASSIAIPLANPAFQSAASGPAGSVSTSFWYEWVHADGTPVTAINAGPVHVTGVTPTAGGSGSPVPTSATVFNAAPQSAGYPAMVNDGTNPDLGPALKADGSIDFRAAGGSSYYRLLVWPESANPTTVTADHGAPVIQYAAPPTDHGEAFTVATVFDSEQAPTVAAPTIRTPASGSTSGQATVSGTALPGAAITLTLDGVTLVDETTVPAVTADATGAWSYTLPPGTTDGTHTVEVRQTEQDSAFRITSAPAQATFTLDTTAPDAPVITSPTTGQTTSTTPTVTGTGEPGTTVTITDHTGRTVATTTIAPDGTFTTPVDTLTPGPTTLTVTTTDTAGNTSASTVTFTTTEPVEPTEPAAPVQPTEPVAPVAPVEPAEPAEPVAPVDSGRSTGSGAPSAPGGTSTAIPTTTDAAVTGSSDGTGTRSAAPSPEGASVNTGGSVVDTERDPAWSLAGLLGALALAGTSLWLLLVHRRRREETAGAEES
jgi:hypothetical protein